MVASAFFAGSAGLLSASTAAESFFSELVAAAGVPKLNVPPGFEVGVEDAFASSFGWASVSGSLFLGSDGLQKLNVEGSGKDLSLAVVSLSVCSFCAGSSCASLAPFASTSALSFVVSWTFSSVGSAVFSAAISLVDSAGLSSPFSSVGSAVFF